MTIAADPFAHLPPHGSHPPSILRPVRLGDWCAFISHHAERAREPVRVLRVYREEGAGKCYTLTEDGAPFYDVGMSGCACATLFGRIPDDFAEDEAARDAWAAGWADGKHGLPYSRDPRNATGCSVWALQRLAYRAGFRAGDHKGRPVAIVRDLNARDRAAQSIRELGSVPRLFEVHETAPDMREALRETVARLLRDKRREIHRKVPPRPSVWAYAKRLQRFSNGAGPYREACPNICGADDAHLERLAGWRDEAADAAEAWAFLAGAERFPGMKPGATPEAYADSLETGDAPAPELPPRP